MSLALMSIASSCFAMPKAEDEEEKGTSIAPHSPAVSPTPMTQLSEFMQTTSRRLEKIESTLAALTIRVDQLENRHQSNPIQSNPIQGITSASLASNNSSQVSSFTTKVPFENQAASLISFIRSPANEKMLETAEVTLKSFLENGHSPSTALFFGGKAGTGKTTLGVGVGRACEDNGKKVVFIQTSQLLKLYALSGDKEKTDLLSHDVFILDDFNGATGGMESGFLKWLIPELHLKGGKLLIVTSNSPFDNLLKTVIDSTKEDAERLKRRINELFNGRTFFIEK